MGYLRPMEQAEFCLSKFNFTCPKGIKMGLVEWISKKIRGAQQLTDSIQHRPHRWLFRPRKTFLCCRQDCYTKKA